MIIIKTLSSKKALDAKKYVEDIPYVGTSPEIVLGKILIGEYSLWGFYEEEKLIGALVYSRNSAEATVIGVSLRKRMSSLREDIFDAFREIGVRKLSAVSKHNEEFFIKFSGFKKEWTYYTKEL